MKVLIVDDSRFTRALLRRELEPEAQVVEAANGREALESLQRDGTPDFILADLLMPEMSGFEFVKEARDRGFVGPIVVCTANTQPAVEHRVREIGATEFVPKPELLVPGRARSLVVRLAGTRYEAELAQDPSCRSEGPNVVPTGPLVSFLEAARTSGLAGSPSVARSCDDHVMVAVTVPLVTGGEGYASVAVPKGAIGSPLPYGNPDLEAGSGSQRRRDHWKKLLARWIQRTWGAAGSFDIEWGQDCSSDVSVRGWKFEGVLRRAGSHEVSVVTAYVPHEAPSAAEQPRVGATP